MTMTLFEETIKKYLDEKAENDIRFAIKYMNKQKSIEECCRYICDEVRKTNRRGFADAEIYGMAIHYYDETDLKAPDSVNCEVVVNREIQLTDEEKARIAQEARKKVEEAELQKQMAKIRDEQAKEAKRKQEADKRKQEQAEKDGMLFLF